MPSDYKATPSTYIWMDAFAVEGVGADPISADVAAAAWATGRGHGLDASSKSPGYTNSKQRVLNLIIIRERGQEEA